MQKGNGANIRCPFAFVKGKIENEKLKISKPLRDFIFIFEENTTIFNFPFSIFNLL